MTNDEVLEQLATGPRTLLRDLASASLPERPGIYALWRNDALLYVGISRVDPERTRNPQAAGLPGRLNTYRLCRITSDFALGCALRYVIPSLNAGQLEELAAGAFGQKELQPIVQRWVWENITFSAVITPAGQAIEVERGARREGLPGVGPPGINPS